MHRLLLIPALCCAMLVAHSAATHAQEAMAGAEARVIVKFKADSPLLRKDLPSVAVRQASQAEALGKRVGVGLRTGAAVAERTQVVFAAGMTSEQLAQRLAAEGDVEYAVPDRRRRRTSAPNDPLYLSGGGGGPAVGQWYLRAPDGQLRSSINVEPAWDSSSNGATVVVAVLDTGVRYDHPDLKTVAAGGSLLPGYDMISDLFVANDGDGRDPDPSDPGDWITEAEQDTYGCGAEGSSWHGTQTTGLIAALTNNGIGMASVGRRNVRVVPVRVLGKCGGFDSDILAGMLWAAGLSVPGVPANPNPARVLNVSLGGDEYCSNADLDAVARISAVGTVVVAAAGNSSHALGSPANCPGVVAVGGLAHRGTKVSFSSLGSQVSISAPGGNCGDNESVSPCLYPILTTANAGLTIPLSDAQGGSIYTDGFHPSLGTSFSAPLVSGTVALMLSVQPSLTPAQVLALLQGSAASFPTAASGADLASVSQCVTNPAIGLPQLDQGECLCTATTCGAGMLDAGAAVRAALGGAPPTPSTGTRTVTEFYHPAFDHYFITADPAETAALAAGTVPPWVATGKTFRVWDKPGTNIANVCRFFTSFFLPKSAHYFSNRAIECPGLAARSPLWVLEDPNAFYMMPVQTACPMGTQPLYRVFNNARGGAPNYRYTIDLQARASMMAASWQPDGDGEDGVFACLPP